MNLAPPLEHALPAALLQVVREIAALAAQWQLPLWLVGGPVRDLILGRPNTDLDLVLEGDAIVLATTFAAQRGAKVTTHTAFGTATVLLSDGASIDFVTARSERYPHPAALPVVTPAPIRADLQRRDFTINTLALSLAPHSWGEVLDPMGGIVDIEHNVVRVLHDRSFIDDPTRILRAVRFAARLEYQIDPYTLRLLAAARRYLEQTTPARILHELRLLVREAAPERALRLLEALGVCAPLAITWQSSWGIRAFEAARVQPMLGVDQAQVLLGLLAPGELHWLAHYSLTAAEQRMFKQVAELQRKIAKIEALQDDGALDQLLQPFEPAALFVLRWWQWENSALATAIDHYLNDLRPIRTWLNGDDLRRLGLPPCPHYRTLFAELRAAQLRGVVRDRAAAEEWVQTHR